MSTSEKPSEPIPQLEPDNPERREALLRIAKFGAYTAPALLAMLKSDKAAAIQS